MRTPTQAYTLNPHSFLVNHPTSLPPHNIFFQKAVLRATSASLVPSPLRSGCGLLAVAQKPLLPDPSDLHVAEPTAHSYSILPSAAATSLSGPPLTHPSLGRHAVPASVLPLSGKQRTQETFVNGMTTE